MIESPRTTPRAKSLSQRGVKLQDPTLSGTYEPPDSDRIPWEGRQTDIFDEPVSPWLRALLWIVGLSVLMAIPIVTVIRRSAHDVGIETVWFAPSLCSAPAARYHKFVSFVDPSYQSAGTRVEEDDEEDDEDGEDSDEDSMHSAAASGAIEADSSVQPTLGDACPVALAARAQEFLLPAELSWAPSGYNESLVVFRGEEDRVVLSFALRDAHGKVLLSEEGVILGDEPQASAAVANAAANGADASGADASGAAAASPTASAPGRRLLFGGFGGWPASEQHDVYSHQSEQHAATSEAAEDAAEAAEAMEGAEAMEEDAERRPASRMLLKGGGHSHSGRAGAALSGPHVTHSSVTRPWGAGAPSRTSYGLTSRARLIASDCL